MKTKLLLLICYLLSPLAYGQARREIPASWIEKLQKYDYKTSANDLVSEFQAYIAPDSIVKFYGTISLNSLFANLDADKDIEILLLMGEQHTKIFCVLDWIGGSYKLIYKQNLLTRYVLPDIKLIVLDSPSKVFSVQESFGSTGSYHTQITENFYRFEDNAVRLCLTVNKHNSNNYRDFVTFITASSHLKSNIEVHENMINVEYQHTFGIIMPNNEFVTIFERVFYIDYKWNEEKKIYKVTLPEGISEEKLKAIEGNYPFQQAFQEEIKAVRENGTEAQKKALKLYFKD